MQSQQSDNGDDQNSAVQIREEETENFNVLLHEIWRRFTEKPIKMRRSRCGFKIDDSTNS
jgi:hypothetical protein